MSKITKINLNGPNTDRLRALQRAYDKKHSPLRVAMDTLANIIIEHGSGSDAVRKRLNLDGGK